jgi:hypothetical protein
MMAMVPCCGTGSKVPYVHVGYASRLAAGQATQRCEKRLPPWRPASLNAMTDTSVVEPSSEHKTPISVASLATSLAASLQIFRLLGGGLGGPAVGSLVGALWCLAATTPPALPPTGVCGMSKSCHDSWCAPQFTVCSLDNGELEKL